MAKIRSLLSLTVTALVLTGCGASTSLPTTPARGTAPASYQNRYPLPAPGALAPGLPGQPGAAGAGAAEGLVLLAAMRKTLSEIHGFDAEIKSYSEGNFKVGVRVSELRKSTTKARLVWSKPAKFRAEVLETTNQLLVGAAMATPNGTKITARAKGLLGLIPFHMEATDPRLGNNRNHLFTQNSPKVHMDRLTSPTAVWTVVADETVEGTPVKMIVVDNVKRLDKEIDREVIAIDPSLNALRRLVMYKGATRVIDHTMVKFRWNPKTTSDMFNL